MRFVYQFDCTKYNKIFIYVYEELNSKHKYYCYSFKINSLLYKFTV